ncbi:DUF5641 domain-containing protein [Trichonephila clavipes]|nr:DUF5641 domain-containing protein [Trichonephila clavipes]
MDPQKMDYYDANLMEQWKKENFNVHPASYETVSLGAKWKQRMKCLLQDLWKEEIQWDDPLPTHIEKGSGKNGIPPHGTIVLVRKTQQTSSRGLSADCLVSNSRWWTAKYFVSENIDWKFIPPKSPHFGGLWEAGVKSVKHHLKRAIGNLHFTFEEFETFLIQVEGILNSRPLTPLSSDADNFDVLTPGHFLIGRPITSIPEPNLIDVNENRLSRREKITKVVQRTWKKWKSDYLNTLQARSKWITEKNDLMIGQMVLIKEDFLPINTWPLGRILEVYHGSDGKVRVVKVKTQSGEFKRAISKIAVLPIDTK